jgi:hypothetical protein
MEKLYIFVILLLVIVIIMQPKPGLVLAPQPPAPRTEISTSVASPQPQASCENDQLARAAEAECRAAEKALAEPLQQRAQSLEKQVRDTFGVLAQNWNRTGKLKAQGQPDRDLLIKEIKSEVLSSCRR